MTEQPILHTPRLLLRPFAPADAADVQRLAGAFEVADTTLNIPHPYPDGLAPEWIGRRAAELVAGNAVTYAMTLRDGGALAGVVSLGVTARHRRAELGYWAGVPFWGRGYTTEACAALLGWAFEALGLNKVTATHFTRNPASGRVMETLGMTHEGTLRQHFLKNGRFEDVEAYGLLAEEWHAAGPGAA